MIAIEHGWGSREDFLSEKYGVELCPEPIKPKSSETDLSKSWRTGGYQHNVLCAVEDEWNIFSRKISTVLMQPVSGETDNPEEDRNQLKARFDEISRQWKSETGGMSSVSQIISNKYYLRVIALGKPAIPLIIEDLRKEAAPWFSALSVLTERDDIGRDHRGQFRKIANAWIDWWESEGYLTCQ